MFKIGDNVKATMKFKSDPPVAWDPAMENFIGKPGIVTAIDSKFVTIRYPSDRLFSWPVQCVVLEREFDITADISRQYNAKGDKVLAIVNTGTDIPFPYAVVVEGLGCIIACDKTGNTTSTASYKLVTRSELEPNIESYTVFSTTTKGRIQTKTYCVLADLKNGLKGLDCFSPSILKIEKTVYDPNTKQYKFYQCSVDDFSLNTKR